MFRTGSVLWNRLRSLWNTNGFERVAVGFLLIVTLANNLLWSATIPFVGDPYGAPDEIHHFEVPRFAFTYHRYPVFGSDRDLYIRVPPGQPDDVYHRIYGWYAASPWGAYLYGAATMLALGWTPLAGTIYSARLSSVIMGVLVVYLAYLIARRVFPTRMDLRLGVPFLIASIPQVTYVSAYFNADMFSILCTTLVMYAWVEGVQNGFAWRTSVFLGLSLGLSVLTRLNCWIIVFPFSLLLLLLSWRRHPRDFIARTGLVCLIPVSVFIIWFIYNKATYGDIWAKQLVDQVWRQDRPFQISYAAQGYTFLSLLRKTPWLDWTFTSFWCRLGYMYVPLSPWYYKVILGFCAASALGLGLGFLRRVPRSGFWRSWRFQVLALFAVISALVIGASLYNSFYNDFQAQGRYVFTALIPLGVLLVLGLGEVTTNPRGQRLIWIFAGLWMVFLQAASFNIYLIRMIVLRLPST